MLKKKVIGTSPSCKSTVVYETSTSSPQVSDQYMSTPKASRTTQEILTQQSSSTYSKTKRKLSPEGK